jgi:hypothetical protein
LDRSEAIKLLKELVSLGLVLPALVSIEKNKLGAFSLIMKGDSNFQAMEQFVFAKNLAFKEEKGFFIIYTP